MKKFTLLITLVTMFGLTVSAQAELFDRGDNLIYDDVLDITWLVDESFANESMKWDEAMVWAEDLEYYGYTDWRLPTIPCTGCDEEGEMKHLYNNESDYMLFFGEYLSDDGALYWYDTEVVSTTKKGNNNNQAWYLNFDNGKENKKGGTSFVLAVADGDIAIADTEVPLDIKPTSCPNPLNTNNQGVLPVAILGTSDFDVNEIDVASLRLENVAPIRSNLEDVAAPFEPFTEKENCDFDCNEWGPDGYLDLTLKFDAQEIVDALGEVNDGECRVLTLSGELLSGTPITGVDVVRILKKK